MYMKEHLLTGHSTTAFRLEWTIMTYLLYSHNFRNITQHPAI
nr:Hypothetical protein [Raoultella ornithinolytica]